MKIVWPIRLVIDLTMLSTPLALFSIYPETIHAPLKEQHRIARKRSHTDYRLVDNPTFVPDQVEALYNEIGFKECY